MCRLDCMGGGGVPNKGSDRAIAAVTVGSSCARWRVSPILTVVAVAGIPCKVAEDAETRASCSREDRGVVLVTLRLVPVPTTSLTPTTDRYLSLA